MTGCCSILRHELDKRNIKINRVAGASAGAWMGLFLCINLTIEQWIETYYGCKEGKAMNNFTVYESYDEIVLPWLRNVMPKDAYKQCSGRLFISITTFDTVKGFENMIVSEYSSNEDLINACKSSGTIPFFSEPNGLR